MQDITASIQDAIRRASDVVDVIDGSGVPGFSMTVDGCDVVVYGFACCSQCDAIVAAQTDGVVCGTCQGVA